MNEILGYGEDALTYWALKERLSEILKKLDDSSNPSDCLVFFRPSFGRRGGGGRAEFGEFDAILASSENVYLIESKWDKSLRGKGIALGEGQIRRHEILAWYLRNWDAQRYSNNWAGFENEFQSNFARVFQDRKIAPAGSRLAKDLEFVLNRLQEHRKRLSCAYRKPRNVLLYFYGNKSRKTEEVVAKDPNFEVVNISYSEYTSGNFVPLDC
jgi:hypothetical protein